MDADRLRGLIRDVPDFPRPGILFRDISPLLGDAVALHETVEALAALARPLQIDVVIAAEARGFLLGPALALELGAGFALARKPGRLPRETVSAAYALEYGQDTLELHSDAMGAGTRVLVHDDLLATGGTAGALCKLVEQAGASVAACAFIIELAALGGRAALAGYDVRALMRYDD
jgi:adenine phosphoribosyltransferase